jgi:hypothetical protein
MPEFETPIAEAERQVREAVERVARQHDLIAALWAARLHDEERRAREGLFELTEIMEAARRRLEAMKSGP